MNSHTFIRPGVLASMVKKEEKVLELGDTSEGLKREYFSVTDVLFVLAFLIFILISLFFVFKPKNIKNSSILFLAKYREAFHFVLFDPVLKSETFIFDQQPSNFKVPQWSNPKVSLDGKFVVFVELLTILLWRVSFEDGNIEKYPLPSDRFEEYNLTSDGKGIIFVKDKKIFKTNFDNFDKLETLKIPENYYKNVFMNEDKEIFCSIKRGVFIDIYRINHRLNDDEIKPFLNLTDVESFPFMNLGRCNLIFIATRSVVFKIIEISKKIVKEVYLENYEDILNVNVSKNGKKLYVIARKTRKDLVDETFVLEVEDFDFYALKGDEITKLTGKVLCYGAYSNLLSVI